MGTGGIEQDDEALLLQMLMDDGFALGGTGPAEAAAPRPRADRTPAPAAAPQRRFWIQERVEAVPGLNTLGCLIHLPVTPDAAALSLALRALAHRHEALRTRFVECGGDVLETVDPVPDSLPVIPLTHGAEDLAAHQAFVEQPFALDQAPLWRIGRFTGAPAPAPLLFACHHSILDWTGARLLADELAALHDLARTPGHRGLDAEALAALLPAPPLQQADVGAWHRSEARRDRREVDAAHWRHRLADPAPPLTLVAATSARPDGKGPAGRTCRCLPLTLDAEFTAAVRRFAGARTTTPFMVLLSTFATVLGRFALAEDVSIGTAVDNRSAPGTEEVIGCLIDMVALRCDLSGAPTFAALVDRLHTAAVADLSHTELGFADVVALVNPDRRAGALPLFQALFNLLPDAAPAGTAGARLEPLPATLARADIALELRDTGATFTGRLEVRDGLLPPGVAEALAEAIPCLLRAGLARPDRPAEALPLLDPAEAPALLGRLNPPMPPAPTESLGALFVARAEADPGATALIEGAHSLSYAGLHARATALAEALVDRGLRPGKTVAILLDRSIDLAVALLAGLRAGGVVLPLDPGYPAERLAAILADSAASLLIARTTPDWLPPAAKVTVVPPDAPPVPGTALPPVGADDPAYLIYTSGSTGTPKGVVGLHRGAVNRLQRMWEAFPFQPGERSVQKTSTAFVDFVWEFFGPLLAGVPSVIADAATARDPQALTALMHDHGVSRIVLVPSLLRAWLDTVPDLGRRLAALRICISSGEALPADLARRIRDSLPGCTLLNLYGSSEVSADCTWHVVSSADVARVPIGRPIPGNHIVVEDAGGNALPVGAPGDLVVTGHGVAQGYLNNAAATAERFCGAPPPTAAGPHFRTGDLGFWRTDGSLIALGRRDRQVKIQGVRVEPAEIEALLTGRPDVRAAHVLARPGHLAGSTVLVAYVVREDGTSDTQEPAQLAASLRAFLASRLPAALVPEAVMPLDRLPLNANGKVDGAALPPPYFSDAAETAEADPQADDRALTPLETTIAEIWSRVLGRPVTRPDTDFFLSGGSSLQAILAAARLGETLGRTLPVAWLFDTPRLSAFAGVLAAEQAEGTVLPPLTAADRHGEGPIPVTHNQAWLWEEYRRQPSGIAYNMPAVYHLTGPLDTSALARAVDLLAARHAALRTRLVSGETGLVQQVDPPPRGIMVVHDLRDSLRPDEALRRLIETESRRPFALDKIHPFRATLAVLGEDTHGLILVTHHMAADGWSGQLLVADLGTLYTALIENHPLPAPPAFQCADVGRWQQRVRARLGERLSAYQASLAGAEAPRLAGLRRPAPAADTVPVGAGGPVGVRPVPLAPDVLGRLRSLAEARGTSEFVLLLSAWSALLARFGDTERPLIATPFAGRDVPGLQTVVGFLANAVFLNIDLRDDPTFDQVVDSARAATVEGMRYQDVPAAWIQAAGTGTQSPLREPGPLPTPVQAMIIVEDIQAWNLHLPGIGSRQVFSQESLETRVDLALIVSTTAEGARIRLEYGSNRLPPAVAERLADGLAALITAAVGDPSTPLTHLPLSTAVTPDAAEQDTSLPPPAPAAETLEGLLHLWAEDTPDAPAVTDGRVTLSFAELRTRALGVAGRLQALGVHEGDRVGLVAAASPWQSAAILGILGAGATVVPVDPAYPRSRIADTLSDATVTAVLTDRPLDYPCAQARIDLGNPSGVGAPPMLLDDTPAPAAVIYTSGTTGKPKGVQVSQAALCRIGAALADAYDLREGDRVLQVVSPAFDVALSDLAMSLSAGATLVTPPREAVLPGRTLLATLATYRVTHMQAPAAVLAATVFPGSGSEKNPLPALRVVAVGGEVCPVETARRWSRDRRLFIAYGPTETTVTAALLAYDGTAAATSIGRPFGGAILTVRDPMGRPLPTGVAGELCIGGPNVTLGYLGRPDLTSDRFVPDPARAGGAVLFYRTGDKVRREEDGTFTFLGRLDRQVKLRGFRIEPGETEAVLAARPGVSRALAAVRADALGERRLMAWVTAEPDTRLDTAALRQTLRKMLPDHLVPAAIGLLPAVPLTANSKIDWDALPLPEAPATSAAGHPPRQLPSAPPRERPRDCHEIQRALAGVWSTLLNRADIGPDDNFFDIGGHSILVVRLQDELVTCFGIDLPLGELFATPTLRSLAARLAAHQERTLPAAGSPDPAPTLDPAPNPAPAAEEEEFTL